jgi:hypothetical protein
MTTRALSPRCLAQRECTEEKQFIPCILDLGHLGAHVWQCTIPGCVLAEGHSADHDGPTRPTHLLMPVYRDGDRIRERYGTGYSDSVSDEDIAAHYEEHVAAVLTEAIIGPEVAQQHRREALFCQAVLALRQIERRQAIYLQATTAMDAPQHPGVG